MDETIMACCNIASLVVSKTLEDGDYVLNLDYYTVCNNRFNSLFSFYEDKYTRDEDDDDCDDDDYDNDDCEPDNYFSKTDYLNAITTRLAGYVAEDVVLHKNYNNTLEHFSIINKLLFTMANCGMFGLELNYFFSRHDRLPYSNALVEKLNQVFNETIDSCYQKAKAIVEKNAELIQNLIPILLEKKVLDKTACELILVELGGIQN